LSEERRAIYDDFKRQAREPQPIDMVLPVTRVENTRDAEDKPLPTRKKHLLSDENRDFPVEELNDWELKVLDTELERSETIAWYRNPSTPDPDALQIPWQAGNQWKAMQPDFIFFHARQDGTIGGSIVDPHGHHLSDALPKLKGLARFAERYGDRFLRIEAITRIDTKDLSMLDLKEPAVRAAIESASTALEAYASEHSSTYV
jgi:hypothetical protein